MYVSNVLKTTCMCGVQATANMYIIIVRVRRTYYAVHVSWCKRRLILAEQSMSSLTT